jgi:preprotein translocase subunit YajC
LLLAQDPAPKAGPAAAPAASAPSPTASPAASQPAAPTAAPASAPVAGQPATAPANPTPKAEPPQSPFGGLIVFVPVIALFYFMILRPQQQQEKKRKAMVDQAEKNTRVMTTGGMYGTIVSVDKEANTVLIRIGTDPGVKVEFARSAIAAVVDGGDKDKKDAS